jgi:hypothetical protein
MDLGEKVSLGNETHSLARAAVQVLLRYLLSSYQITQKVRSLTNCMDSLVVA